MHNKQEDLCCFEQLLINPDLPSFSNFEQKYKLIKRTNIFYHERNDELSEILRKDNKITKSLANTQTHSTHKVDHFYVDFSVWILKEKLQNLDVKKEYKMNWLELARIIEKRSSDFNFYQAPTIQRLIDTQWETSRIYLTIIFAIYFFLYLLQFIIICLYPDDHQMHTHRIKYCLVARSIMFSIEAL